VKRILIGDFGSIATLGLRELLEGQCDIVATGTADQDITSQVRATAADVVLIDSDTPDAVMIVASLIEHAPGVTVIGCSLTEPRFSVLSGPGASYTAELEPSSLLEAINGP
jgi:AmiR/NasT family two-component response regulator